MNPLTIHSDWAVHKVSAITLQSSDTTSAAPGCGRTGTSWTFATWMLSGAPFPKLAPRDRSDRSWKSVAPQDMSYQKLILHHVLHNLSFKFTPPDIFHHFQPAKLLTRPLEAQRTWPARSPSPRQVIWRSKGPNRIAHWNLGVSIAMGE